MTEMKERLNIVCHSTVMAVVLLRQILVCGRFDRAVGRERRLEAEFVRVHQLPDALLSPLREK